MSFRYKIGYLERLFHIQRVPKIALPKRKV